MPRNCTAASQSACAERRDSKSRLQNLPRAAIDDVLVFMKISKDELISVTIYG